MGEYAGFVMLTMCEHCSDTQTNDSLYTCKKSQVPLAYMYLSLSSQSFAFAVSLIIRLSIFPAALFGIASTNLTPPLNHMCLGFLPSTSRSSSCRTHSSGLSRPWAVRTTHACGNSPEYASGTPMTPQSATEGWPWRMSSRIAGATGLPRTCAGEWLKVMK